MEFQLVSKKMNPNKFLVTITNKNDIEIYKKARVTNFLFPLKDFCVGFPSTFSLEEINDGYLYINRILDTRSYQKLKQLLKKISPSIKGIVFEDYGIITLAKELNLKQELILYQTHFATNHESINEMLKYVNSLVIGTDITVEEIKIILEKIEKPLVFLLYGLVPGMYSRRTLLKNFAKQFSTPKKEIVVLEEQVSKKKFIAVENEYGTVLYHEKYLNAQHRIEDKNIKYYLINPLFLSKEEQKKMINAILQNETYTNLNNDFGFLDTKTIYKLKEEENE